VALPLLATALIPLGGLAAGGLATLPSVLAGLGTGLAAVKVGTSGVGTAIQDIVTAVSSPSLANFATAKTALDGLTPSARNFVGVLGGMVPEFEKLKSTTQENLFAGLAPGLKDLQPIFQTISPFITGAAKDIGQLAAGFLQFLGSSKGLSDINTIFKAGAGFMKEMGGVALTLFKALTDGAAKASPLLKPIGDTIKNLADSFAHWVDDGGFQKFLEWVQQNGPKIVTSIGDAVKDVGRLLVALAPFGPVLLETVKLTDEPIKVLTTAVTGITDAVEYTVNHWSGAWQAIHDIVNTAWHAIDNDVFQPIENFFTNTIPHALSVASGAFTTGFQAIHDIVNTIWHAIDNDVFHPIEDFLQSNLTGAINTLKDVWDAVWGALHSAVEAAWKVIQVPLHAISDCISAVKSALHDVLNLANLIPGVHIGGSGSNTTTNAIDPTNPGTAFNAAGTGLGTFQGLSWVGEKGPELVNFGSPVQIIPNSAFAGAAPQARSGPTIAMSDVHFHDEADIDILTRKMNFAYMAGQL
jgi:phage-related protein